MNPRINKSPAERIQETHFQCEHLPNVRREIAPHFIDGTEPPVKVVNGIISCKLFLIS